MEKRRFERRIALDSHLKGTRRFWNFLVTNCCIDCCGLDALELSVERIIWAGQKVGVQQLIGQLEDAIYFMQHHELKMVQSRDVLCCGGEKEQFMVLFRSIQYVLLGVYIGSDHPEITNKKIDSHQNMGTRYQAGLVRCFCMAPLCESLPKGIRFSYAT